MYQIQLLKNGHLLGADHPSWPYDVATCEVRMFEQVLFLLVFAPQPSHPAHDPIQKCTVSENANLNITSGVSPGQPYQFRYNDPRYPRGLSYGNLTMYHRQSGLKDHSPTLKWLVDKYFVMDCYYAKLAKITVRMFATDHLLSNLICCINYLPQSVKNSP